MKAPSRRRRIVLSAGAAALLTGLPAAAFLAAPSGRAAADSSPGANLAGITASAYASGVQIAPLTPGLVGAGDVAQGNLVETAVPYASVSTTTGPTSAAVASPAYPGDTAAGAGNAIATFAPQFPPQLVSLLNYPVLARAAYPAQVSTPSSASYAPPGTSGSGVGTASASATEAGAQSQATTASQSFASAGVSVGSATTTSSTVLSASSVLAKSHSDVGTVTLLGVIVISNITSDASASSDGTNPTPSSDFHIGSVTVAGQPASIGPDGITLASSSTGGMLVPYANQALVALKQAGISVRTVAPTTTTDGTQVTVTSGGLIVNFVDANIPNPGGQVPLSSVGFNLNIGISQASADATALPPFADTGGGSTGQPVPPATGAATPTAVASTGGSPPASGNSPAPAATAPSSAPAISVPRARTGSSPGPAAPIAQTPAASVLGLPVKTAWVVIAVLLSLVAAGPLLGYANWQLLRGRKT